MDKDSKIRPTILVICVNYHNEYETVSFVQELFKQKGEFYLYVVIVDNSDTNSEIHPSLAALACDTRIMVIKAGNLGYFGGAARGLECYLERYKLSDWIIVSNTDISFPSNDMLNLLLFYNNDPPAVIAPAIISQVSGLNQNPFMLRRPSRLRMHFYKWCFRSYFLLKCYEYLSAFKKCLKKHILGKRKKRQKLDQLKETIYAPHGSFIIFNKKYFISGGTLDYKGFLFGEEIYVAETVRRLSLHILYEPRFVVIHREHSSMSVVKSRILARYKAQSAKFCADTFFR